MQHYLLRSRNLLYTGLTRPKQLAILMGPTKAIGFAVKQMVDRQRYTALADRLKLSGEKNTSCGEADSRTPLFGFLRQRLFFQIITPIPHLLREVQTSISFARVNCSPRPAPVPASRNPL